MERNIFEEENWQAPHKMPFDDLIVKEARATFSRYNLGLFIYTAAAYAVIIVLSIILQFILPEQTLIDISNSVWYQWLTGVGPMYLVGLPLMFLIIRGMPVTKRKKKKIDITEFFAWFLVAQAFMMAGNFIGMSVNEFIGYLLGHEIGNATSDLVEKSPVWLLILIVVVVAPVIEELLFRKWMIDRFSKYGDKLAIIFSAVAFGLFHGNFHQFFYAAFLGILLGYAYTRSGDIKYPIILHMLLNFLGSVVTLPVLGCQEYLMPFLTGESPIELIDMRKLFMSIMGLYSYSFIQYVMAIAGVFILVKAIRERRIAMQRNPEVMIPRGRVTEAVLFNIGTVLFLIASLSQFALNIIFV